MIPQMGIRKSGCRSRPPPQVVRRPRREATRVPACTLAARVASNLRNEAPSDLLSSDPEVLNASNVGGLRCYQTSACTALRQEERGDAPTQRLCANMDRPSRLSPGLRLRFPSIMERTVELGDLSQRLENGDMRHGRPDRNPFLLAFVWH